MFDRIIKVVDTPEELKVYQELIYKVYCQELKWFDSSQYPQDRVEDEYDNQAKHFLTIDTTSQEVVSGMRLIRPMPSHLPIFSKFGERKPTPGFFQEHNCQFYQAQEIEISQVAASKKFRNRSLNLTFDMVKTIYNYGKQNHIGYMYFTIDLSYFIFVHKIHVLIEPIGRPRLYFGSWVVPSIIFFEQMSQHLKKHNPEAFAYISKGDNIVGDLNDADLQKA